MDKVKVYRCNGGSEVEEIGEAISLAERDIEVTCVADGPVDQFLRSLRPGRANMDDFHIRIDVNAQHQIHLSKPEWHQPPTFNKDNQAVYRLHGRREAIAPVDACPYEFSGTAAGEGKLGGNP